MFHIIRKYSDNVIKSELAENIIGVLTACSIYLSDRNCISIIIEDLALGKTIFNYSRDQAPARNYIQKIHKNSC